MVSEDRPEGDTDDKSEGEPKDLHAGEAMPVPEVPEEERDDSVHDEKEGSG
jgi:hypothetical protein